MRVLIDAEEVIEVKQIIGNLEDDGVYTVYFESMGDEVDEGLTFEYVDISPKEAQLRCICKIREALEKGYADFSEEPIELV